MLKATLLSGELDPSCETALTYQKKIRRWCSTVLSLQAVCTLKEILPNISAKALLKSTWGRPLTSDADLPIDPYILRATQDEECVQQGLVNNRDNNHEDWTMSGRCRLPFAPWHRNSRAIKPVCG